MRWQTPEHGIAEIDDMPDAVLDELSQRTRQVEARLDHKLGRFRDTFDREPTQRELWRLEREAVLDSRPAKQRVGEHVDLRGEWAERVEGVGFDPSESVRWSHLIIRASSASHRPSGMRTLATTTAWLCSCGSSIRLVCCRKMAMARPLTSTFWTLPSIVGRVVVGEWSTMPLGDSPHPAA
ncbi:MAG: hypothetical protein QOK43_2787 [Acidimicrobiaceae bacterium]|nr:hypothetical protein [Acidimicrobiaceae bacterium]